MPNPNFRADLPTVQPGQCTTLRWDVDEIAAIYFFDGANETGVGGHDSRQVCPQQTTTYRLRIVNRDGTQEYYDLTVGVGTAYINFWVDHPMIAPGQCTTLRWDVREVQAVYLNVGNGDEGVVGQGERQVCPPGTATYYLKVIHRDGNQETRTVTVNVSGVAPHP